jgi:hypothetical protein
MQQRRVHLKFSGHYRGINELEKWGSADAYEY